MILVGGGSGFIGRRLVNRLRSVGQRVTVISRIGGPEQITWDEVERAGIPDGVTAVVNLAGRNILEANPLHCNPKIYERYKRDTLDSRIVTTDTLVQAMHAANPRPTVLVNASAIGFYNPKATAEQDEESPGGVDIAQHDKFIAPLVSDWERAALFTPTDVPAEPAIRRVVIRIGIVLGRDGGMIQQSYLPFKLGLGGKMGNGQQWFPWVHVDDVVELFRFAIFNTEIRGILNGVAPGCVTNEEFTKAYGRALNRPTIFPIPEFALKMVYGNRAKIILESAKVVPRRTLEYGFKFRFPDVDDAMRDIVGNK